MKRNDSIELSPSQEKAIELLLIGCSKTDVAKQLEISRTTLYEWKNQSMFIAAYNRRKREFKESIESEVIALGNMAVETIKQCLSSGNHSVRMKAAIFVLSKLDLQELGPENTSQIEFEKLFDIF